MIGGEKSGRDSTGGDGDEKPQKQESEIGGDKTSESQAEDTKDGKKSDETTKDGTADEKEDTDSFKFIKLKRQRFTAQGLPVDLI
ncbi:hypothetical protein BPAE_0484g00050 [Botrytis paeoniae]|uniref:Uncharacterized protein n=1 Tax=Botrytis paeoniae TaxID=278948 RepID=A0A4Z1EYN3_9HELO|nr:hypothetical protein BPAE_0484g00050 [Botrytis paeoniae]